jgi:hypothetical protein
MKSGNDWRGLGCWQGTSLHELMIGAGASWLHCRSWKVWCLGLRGSIGTQGLGLLTSGVSLIIRRRDGVLASGVTRGAGIERWVGVVTRRAGMLARRAGIVARRVSMVARRAGIVARVVWVCPWRIVCHLDHYNES